MSRFGTPSFIEHVVRHFWFLQFLGWGNKKTPAPAILLGQEITSCGATRLGALFAPTSRALPCTGIWSRSAAPSHILQGGETRALFPIALESPFSGILFCCNFTICSSLGERCSRLLTLSQRFFCILPRVFPLVNGERTKIFLSTQRVHD